MFGGWHCPRAMAACGQAIGVIRGASEATSYEKGHGDVHPDAAMTASIHLNKTRLLSFETFFIFSNFIATNVKRNNQGPIAVVCVER